MKNMTDAYGQALYDYMQGKGGYIILERSDGMIGNAVGPAVYFSEYKDWQESTQTAMTYVKGRVLDIGCGAGRHLLYLQKKGYDVWGIDTSPLVLKICRKQGLKNVRNMSITRLNSSMGIFDTVLLMGNNFGLFGNFKQAKKILKRLYNITSDSARIITESKDPYKSKLPEHVQYCKDNKKKGRMAGQMRIRLRYKKFKTPWYDYLMVSKKEMIEILRGTGWTIDKFIPGPNLYAAVIKKS